MSRCGDPCVPSGWDRPCPQPLASACSELCVTGCGDSRAVIYPPPVVLTFPGPILSSCPQESIVGSCSPPAPGRPGASPGHRSYGSAAGLRGSILSGGSNPYGNAWNSGRSCNSGCSSLRRGSRGPSLQRQYSSCSRGSCGPW